MRRGLVPTAPGAEDGPLASKILLRIRNLLPRLARLVVGLLPFTWCSCVKVLGVTAASPQAQGGHMRLIIGYNEDEKKLIFTDSWGAGHEMKKMRLEHAYRATTGLYTVTPTVN